jgi:Plavaka transposase
MVNTDVEGPSLPREFIRIIPHPHSLDPTPIIVPLDSELSSSLSKTTNPVFQPQTEPWPWAPFQTLADFEYTETAIQGLLSKRLVDKQLAGINSAWAVESRLSIKNYNDMEKVLAKARKHTVQVRVVFTCSTMQSLIKSIEQFTSATVTGTLDGNVHSFTFEFRDPWKWILSLIRDESLAPMNMWNSVRKYYCCGNHEERIYDEPNTADTWWDIDVSFFLPQCSS